MDNGYKKLKEKVKGESQNKSFQYGKYYLEFPAHSGTFYVALAHVLSIAGSEACNSSYLSGRCPLAHSPTSSIEMAKKYNTL